MYLYPMCYYNGCRVTRAEYIRLMAIEKEIKNLLFLNRPVQSGFDYSDWPVIVPIHNGTDIDIQLMHWEYIPPSIHDADELIAARKNFTWLNAKGENIFVNEKAVSPCIKKVPNQDVFWHYLQASMNSGKSLRSANVVSH